MAAAGQAALTICSVPCRAVPCQAGCSRELRATGLTLALRLCLMDIYL